MLQLDPPSGYWCDLHSRDLTELVRAKLAPKRDVVGVVSNLLVMFRLRSPRRPFTVLVRCPGDGQGTEHCRQFVGHFRVLS